VTEEEMEKEEVKQRKGESYPEKSIIK